MLSHDQDIHANDPPSPAIIHVLFDITFADANLLIVIVDELGVILEHFPGNALNLTHNYSHIKLTHAIGMLGMISVHEIYEISEYHIQYGIFTRV